MNDPIVDEVRAIRAQIAEECGYDLQRINEHARIATEKIPGLKYVTVEEMRERRRQRDEALARSAAAPTEPVAGD